ncbi:hypothetical protein ACFU7T_19095 [Streptomyces sp. NPDC057555]|uniref:hypothetical protein n=1 Tax=Streptomyces sp. NPDC057555 TaxID=3346166 RepID=UPI0036BB40F4
MHAGSLSRLLAARAGLCLFWPSLRYVLLSPSWPLLVTSGERVDVDVTPDPGEFSDAILEMTEAVHRVGIEMPKMMWSGEITPGNGEKIAVAVNSLLDDLGIRRPDWDSLAKARKAQRKSRRPGPPLKVAVPIVITALLCIAVGAWALFGV